RAVPQLLEGAVPDLADPLARYAQQRADLLERPLLPVVETVVQVEDLALALGQVGLEHGLEEVPAGGGLDVLLDLGALGAGEALTEAGAVPVAPVDRRIEAELGR